MSGHVGESIVLHGEASSARGGKTIKSYAWTIDSNSRLAQFLGKRYESLATVRLLQKGTFSVMLKVTDSSNYTDTKHIWLTVN